MNAPAAVAERSASNVVHLDDHRNRAEMIRVLQSSLYPGAKPESVELVMGYCSATGLDPMQKPVHIVPMSVKAGKDANGDPIYEDRDTVMPGIGLYRTQAARTGEYVGMDKPVFGPTRILRYKKKTTEWVDGPNGRRQKKDKWIDAEIEYPEWCEVTVYRLVKGVRCPYTAQEFWIENYATASRWSDAPNAMWERRTRGQLAKCAEAQALRKGFPEAVGAAPTAEEMEGRYIDAETVQPGAHEPRSAENGQPQPEQKKPDVKPAAPDDWFQAQLAKAKPLLLSGARKADDVIASFKTKASLSAEQEQAIRDIKLEEAK